MLFQLRNLTDSEYQLVMDAPVLVGILIGSADGVLSAKETKRLREMIQTKVYSEKNDVHLIYKKLAEGELDTQISKLNKMKNEFPTIELKEQFLIEQLKRLNKIFTKLDKTYAIQYRKSLHDIAVAIANATGGVLGIGRVTYEESELLDLSFIDKP